MAVHNWDELAGKTWDILTACAAEKQNLTYKVLAGRLGLPFPEQRRNLSRQVLDRVDRYCREQNVPCLPVLVVRQDTLEPGEGIRCASVYGIEASRGRVYTTDWSVLPNPFAFALDGTTWKDLKAQVLARRGQARDVYRKVKDRGKLQELFHDLVYDAYQGRCAFSGSRLKEALEAAHIVPWSEASDEERISPRNGLLLNVYYHRLFDKHLLRLNDDFTLSPDPELDLDSLSEFDREAIEKVRGKRISTPRSPDRRPDEEFIRRRYGNSASVPG